MSKHTPGPWEVRKKGVMENGSDAGTFVGQVGSGLVARTFTNKGNMTQPECLAAAQADARLISAAPDLLEALESLLSVLEYLNALPKAGELKRRAFEAIAKAKGGDE